MLQGTPIRRGNLPLMTKIAIQECHRPLERHCEAHKTISNLTQNPNASWQSPPSEMPLYRHCETHKKISNVTQKPHPPWQSHS
jgi:hypothetical protein